jgi:tRNA1(Val) A37 N6-methylase TrmN6
MSLAHDDEIVKLGPLTQDAFLGGRLTIAQPAKGFRAGLDSVLLGAAVGEGRRTLLDLGAGVGTAALVALAHHAAMAGTLVESDVAASVLASRNLAANGFAARARVIALDLTKPARSRTAAGLEREAYDTVTANPPFYDRGSAPSADRAAARAMPPEALDLWLRTAASHAAPGAEIIFIHTADRLADLLEAFRRFGGITVLPLTPREGEPAHRILVRGIKGSRAPLTLLGSRALHTASGRTFRPEFEAIFRGRDRLHW